MALDFVISKPSEKLRLSLRSKIDQKTKPLGSLGQLESLALQIGLCQNSLTPCLNKPTILIFAGDHGIVEEGVSAYPQSVTSQMVGNFLSGGAAINVFARQHQLELIVIDAGVNADLPKHPKLISAKISKGTHNFLKKPAMSLQACINTIKTGADLVLQQYQNGCNCIGFGEMGIGNTSSAALLMQSLTGIPLKQCVGRGTGINNAQFQNKFNVLQQVLNHHKNLSTPLDILVTLGGYEIAMMVGAYLKAAEDGILIIVDGFIASAALLVAYKLYPEVLNYCVFSHVSNEQGHQVLLKYFNVNALLNLNLRLGEGSGIALAYPLLQSAVLFLTEMATFNEASIDNLDCLHSKI